MIGYDVTSEVSSVKFIKVADDGAWFELSVRVYRAYKNYTATNFFVFFKDKKVTKVIGSSPLGVEEGELIEFERTKSGCYMLKSLDDYAKDFEEVLMIGWDRAIIEFCKEVLCED